MIVINYMLVEWMDNEVTESLLQGESLHDQ